MGTYAKVKEKQLKKIMEWPAMALLSHWLFQSLFYMDTTERWFKIGLDVALTVTIGLFINLFVSGITPWLIAFLTAHSINFFFNGQMWGVLKHYGMVHHSKAEFESYVMAFRERARAEKSVEQILVYGSLARGEWKESSDFDCRIFRRPGIKNGVLASFFLLSERTRALFQTFPLDIYVVDSFHSKNSCIMKEDPQDLLIIDWRLA